MKHWISQADLNNIYQFKQQCSLGKFKLKCKASLETQTEIECNANFHTKLRTSF